MIQEVLYSDLNPGIITKWKVQEGRRVTENDILCEYKGLKLNKVKSQFAGLITKILKKENESVKLGDVLAIMEKCSHTTVWRNVCADCGTMMESQAATGPSTKFVAMMHCVPDLLVSEENALELGRKDKNVLLQRKRLALLVDLDQTIIHTTNDNVPPNLKDVYHFQLQHGREGRKWWYHTKLRPHTERFLKKISEYYELHICTFGVRSYAHAIAGYLDPERKYFQHRILSRDECFHPNLKTLNLKNLFPCGDTMVCIIDDREDVWKSASNMIRVKPYSFFDGSADINAPPLAAKSGQIKEKEPRKQRIIRVPNKKPEAAEEDKPSDENDEQSSDASKVEEFTEMIEWEDSDDYLLHLERILIKIHDSYYKQYEDNSYNPETCNLDLKSIVPSEKMKVLQGCNILFSGVIPLKQKLETSWAYRLAVNFGATVQTELVLEGGSNVTTHVIGMRDGTEKIKKAYKHKIFVVNVDWLLDSIERWEKADESLYPISKEPSHNYLLYCTGGGQQPEEAAPKEEHVEIDEKWRSEILDLCRSAVEEMSDDSDDDDEPVTRKRRHSEDLDELEENPKQMHLELEEEDLNSDENSCNEDSDCCDEGNDYCQDYVNDDDDEDD